MDCKFNIFVIITCHMEYQDDNKGIIVFRIVYFRAWFLKVSIAFFWNGALVSPDPIVT